MLTVQVSFFAQVRLILNRAEVEVSLPEGATVEDLAAHLQKQFPQIAPHLPTCRIAVGVEYASPGTPLADGDDIALIPPVQGG